MKNKTLTPYLAGALIGILLVLSVIVAGAIKDYKRKGE